MKNKLYNSPEYYDIAFSWDITREIEFFAKLFRKYVPFEVKRVLEPACGTGRFLLNLPKHGYRVTGYDKNPEMVSYARKRITDLGVEDMASAVVDDMRSARFEPAFDAAINSINSLGYLLSDDDIIAHFRNTAAPLKKGGIYIVHLACAWDELKPDESDGWVMERGGIRVKTLWTIEKEDREEKLSHQVCKMDIDDNGKCFALEDSHMLRLWFYEDFKRLICDSGKLELKAVHDERQNQIPLDKPISGELGNLYYILSVL
jgi:SAM-dependent methyltransferase